MQGAYVQEQAVQCGGWLTVLPVNLCSHLDIGANKLLKGLTMIVASLVEIHHCTLAVIWRNIASIEIELVYSMMYLDILKR